jgi:predicted transcriptional regulator YdeE
METKEIAAFNFIGIGIRTTNEKGQSSADIAGLWNKFLSEKISDQIPDKLDDTIYCVYTDYEKDYTKPYTTLLGCKVKSLNTIPDNLVGRSFSGGKCIIFTAKGKMKDHIVFREWLKIWTTEIDRAYTADFEVYGTKAQDPDNAEIDIHISIK